LFRVTAGGRKPSTSENRRWPRAVGPRRKTPARGKSLRARQTPSQRRLRQSTVVGRHTSPETFVPHNVDSRAGLEGAEKGRLVTVGSAAAGGARLQRRSAPIIRFRCVSACSGEVVNRLPIRGTCGHAPVAWGTIRPRFRHRRISVQVGGADRVLDGLLGPVTPAARPTSEVAGPDIQAGQRWVVSDGARRGT